jgi:hypothetical protein
MGYGMSDSITLCKATPLITETAVVRRSDDRPIGGDAVRYLDAMPATTVTFSTHTLEG